MIGKTPGAVRAPLGLPAAGRCLVMGILNVTPDSFSDGGRYLAADDAVAHGLAMTRDGADIIDVGGESTRPGAHRVSEAEELQRVLPMVSALTRAGVPVTIDTMRSRVAAAAVALGAVGVNDVSGGLADPRMPAFIAEAKVPYILSHWRPASAVMALRATYENVVDDVLDELRCRLDIFERSGADLSQIVVDPGLGFAKTAEHNWQLLSHLDDLHQLGYPVLIGASRKSFLRNLIDPVRADPTTSQLDTATAVVSAIAGEAGVYCVRVHDVTPSVAAIKIVAAWANGRDGGSFSPFSPRVPVALQTAGATASSSFT